MTKAIEQIGVIGCQYEGEDKMVYDVIIVGSGVGGLLTGAIIAKNGLKTLILEKSARTGGRAMSFEYQPGYIVDMGIHSIRYGKNGIIPTIFNEDLGIPLKLLDYGHSKLFRNGEWISMPNGIEEFMTTPLLTNEEREKFLPLLLEIIKLRCEDFFDVSIESYFKDKIDHKNLWEIIRLIASALMVTPEIERASMGEFIYGIQQIAIAEKSASYPEGGWKSITDQLIKIISSNGEIRLKNTVTKILISNNIVEGVLLSDGTKLISNFVVVAMPSQQIFSILPENEFSPEFVSLCGNVIHSSGLSIDFGLNKRFSEDNGLIAVDEPMGLGVFSSNIDPSVAPADEQLFTFVQHVPREIILNPEIAKQRLKSMEQLINQMYPGFNNHIKWKRPLIVPVMDGAVNYVGQTRDKRPNVKSNAISGLYFSGDTYNGPGLGGDIAPSSARLCAYTILKDV